MKKLLTALVLSLSLFLVACGPSYDFSSEEAFKKSVLEQAEKEGFNENEALVTVGLYTLVVMSENEEDFAKAEKKASEAKTEAEREEIESDFLKPYINGKTIKEMKEYLEEVEKKNK